MIVHLNPLLKREDFMAKSQNQFITSIIANTPYTELTTK
jgi:hypothetical protein